METGIFVLNESTGMTFYGGLIFGAGGFLAVWFVGGRYLCKDKKEAVKRFHDIADMAGCLIPLAHAFGRIGCLFAGCCHGKRTDAWYGIKMWTENGWQKVVPVQLFEAVFLFILSAVLLFWYFARRKKTLGVWVLEKTPLLGAYGILYGVWRFCIEFARGDNRGETVVSFLSVSATTSFAVIGSSPRSTHSTDAKKDFRSIHIYCFSVGAFIRLPPFL
jgi:phosphatidylglycerol:prolipoprotein diacylglycerol transferase